MGVYFHICTPGHQFRSEGKNLSPIKISQDRKPTKPSIILLIDRNTAASFVLVCLAICQGTTSDSHSHSLWSYWKDSDTEIKILWNMCHILVRYILNSTQVEDKTIKWKSEMVLPQTKAIKDNTFCCKNPVGSQHSNYSNRIPYNYFTNSQNMWMFKQFSPWQGHNHPLCWGVGGGAWGKGK